MAYYMPPIDGFCKNISIEDVVFDIPSTVTRLYACRKNIFLTKKELIINKY